MATRVVVVSVLGFSFAALPAVLVRFTLMFYAAYTRDAAAGAARTAGVGPQLLRARVAHAALAADPVPTAAAARRVRELAQPRDEPARARRRSSTFPTTPRFEFWWLRARDLGTARCCCSRCFPIAAAAAGVRDAQPLPRIGARTPTRRESASDRRRDRRFGGRPTCVLASPDGYDLRPMGNLAAMGNLAEMAAGEGAAARGRARALDRPAVPQRGRDRRGRASRKAVGWLRDVGRRRRSDRRRQRQHRRLAGSRDAPRERGS